MNAEFDGEDREHRGEDARPGASDPTAQHNGADEERRLKRRRINQMAQAEGDHPGQCDEGDGDEVAQHRRDSGGARTAPAALRPASSGARLRRFRRRSLDQGALSSRRKPIFLMREQRGRLDSQELGGAVGSLIFHQVFSSTASRLSRSLALHFRFGQELTDFTRCGFRGRNERGCSGNRQIELHGTASGEDHRPLDHVRSSRMFPGQS